MSYYENILLILFLLLIMNCIYSQNSLVSEFVITEQIKVVINKHDTIPSTDHL